MATSNSVRHKFVANKLGANVDEILVISESKPSDAIFMNGNAEESSLLEKSFYTRFQTERQFFCGHDAFLYPAIPIMYKELRMKYIYDLVKEFNPGAMFVFGYSIVKDPLLSLIPNGRFVNLHLGLSPYYRGSGTNFWPFVNQELEYVGASILHIDSGIDTGDIIAHVRPEIKVGDNLHTVGCKVIKEATSCLIKIIQLLKDGMELKRIKQWNTERPRYYETGDFNEEALLKYYENMEAGMIEKFINSPGKTLKLVSLQ